MAESSALPFPGNLFERIAQGPKPPDWLVHEMQQRLVLLINHVLMQERAATERLKARNRRIVRVQWRQFVMSLQVTPAGLFDLAAAGLTPDLHFEVTQESPLPLAQTALRGERPPVRIDGDVEFASDLQWLADNLRWDLEDDLARVVGDVPAHMAAQAARSAADALRSFVRKRTSSAPSAPTDMAPRSAAGTP